LLQVIQRFLDMLLRRRWEGFKVAHHAVLPAQEASYGALDGALPDSLQETLLSLGIARLYQHQSRALERIRSGSHVAVASPTASGKSLIYNLAVSEALLKDDEQRALYLFPIKALSRDQLEALRTFFDNLHPGQNRAPFRAAVYDGDTTPYQRAKIRGNHPHILLTNPDMLHTRCCPTTRNGKASGRICAS
jgi:DEAD/DEAH box helicase domain-containing protein